MYRNRYCRIVVALAIATAGMAWSPTLPGLLNALALAEEKSPVPPRPKPKDPPSDPCAGTKMKSACRNAETVRNILLSAPPQPDNPAHDSLPGDTGVPKVEAD